MFNSHSRPNKPSHSSWFSQLRELSPFPEHLDTTLKLSSHLSHKICDTLIIPKSQSLFESTKSALDYLTLKYEDSEQCQPLLEELDSLFLSSPKSIADRYSELCPDPEMIASLILDTLGNKEILPLNQKSLLPKPQQEDLITCDRLRDLSFNLQISNEEKKSELLNDLTDLLSLEFGIDLSIMPIRTNRR